MTKKMTHRKCAVCLRTLPMTAFWRLVVVRRPTAKSCNDCNNRRKKAKQKERSRAYYQANKELSYAQSKEWRSRNREKVKQYAREKSRLYYADNKEKLKARSAQYRRRNPNYAMAAYWKNRSKILEWVRNNRDRVNVYREQRRVAERGGKLNGAAWTAIKQLFSYRCVSCGTPGNIKPITMDHIVPVSKGGTHSSNNVQPLCRSCNSKKYSKIIDYRPAVIRRMLDRKPSKSEMTATRADSDLRYMAALSLNDKLYTTVIRPKETLT